MKKMRYQKKNIRHSLRVWLAISYRFKLSVCVRIEGKDLVHVIAYVNIHLHKRPILHVGCQGVPVHQQRCLVYLVV